MQDRAVARVGRPRGSSCAMLEEAAAELFLEQTYAGTTLEQIAQLAGVSRNTFFNYFSAKSDLLWVDIDAGLAELPRALKECSNDVPATDAVRHALLGISAGFGPGRVPWALTQSELMGTREELEASALSRFMTQVRLLSHFVARSLDRDGEDLVCRSFAMSVLGAVAAAGGEWARSGVSRGNLAPYVNSAISPVCDGYRSALRSG